MSVLLAITCDRNLVLHCIKSNVYDGLSTDLFTFSELPISHPVHYARAGTTVQGHKGVRGRGGWQLELITFKILAAERIRLMGFDNRLIIDCFANAENILIWLFSTNDSEVRNMNPIT